MPVKHAILALLAQRDLTGYELKVRFERALGDFWQLNSGQVYSTLERLRRDGMIMRQDEHATMERARYTLLPPGRRALDQWFARPLPRLRPVRDPLFVKLVFAEPEQATALLASFAAETRKYARAIETLTTLVARTPLSFGGRTRWLVAEAARLEYGAHRAWLETVARVLAPDAHACAARPQRETGRAESAPGTPVRRGGGRLAAVRATPAGRELAALRGPA